MPVSTAAPTGTTTAAATSPAQVTTTVASATTKVTHQPLGDRGNVHATPGMGAPVTAVVMGTEPGRVTSNASLPPPAATPDSRIPMLQPPVSATSLLPPPPSGFQSSSSSHPPPPQYPVAPSSAPAAAGIVMGTGSQGNGYPPGVGNAVGVIAHAPGAVGVALDTTPPPGVARLQASMRQWQAAENVVLNAFMLQECEPRDKQEDAKAFFTKLADVTGEPAGRVIALVRATVQPAPWGSGYLVVSNRCSSFGCATVSGFHISSDGLMSLSVLDLLKQPDGNADWMGESWDNLSGDHAAATFNRIGSLDQRA